MATCMQYHPGSKQQAKYITVDAQLIKHPILSKKTIGEQRKLYDKAPFNPKSNRIECKTNVNLKYVWFLIHAYLAQCIEH